jgi:hypothetical protein
MDRHTLVGLFEDYRDADSAVQELSEFIDRGNISLVAQETTLSDMQDDGLDTTDSVAAGAEGGATGGAVGGGIAGLIAGLSALVIPGIGPVITVGTIATTLGTTALGAGVGAAAGGIIGALVGLGVPEDEAEIYAEGIRRGGVLLAVEHDMDRHDQVVDILVRNNALDIESTREAWEEEGWTGFENSSKL